MMAPSGHKGSSSLPSENQATCAVMKTDTCCLPVLTIGIAGGTGAGKTTLARAVYDALGKDQNVTLLLHDNYYKCLSHLPMAEREKNNFDHPESLDTQLLAQHILDLKDGKTINVPTYDFKTHTRTKVVSKLTPKPIILVEGILIFAEQCTEPKLVDLMDLKVFVEADADVRLMRRINRDTTERARTIDEVMRQYMATVRPMHNRYVEPSKKVADIVVHSALNKTVLQMITDYAMARVSAS